MSSAVALLRSRPVPHVAALALISVAVAGCSADTTKQDYIQELRVLSENAPYYINFENGPETWVPVTNPGDTTNSWLFGIPNGDIINSAKSGNNAFSPT